MAQPTNTGENTMTVYRVHFQNHVGSATHDIKARTPAKALALARRHVDDDSLDLWFEPYDLTSDVNEIVVCDDIGDELALWRRRPTSNAGAISRGIRSAIGAMSAARIGRPMTRP